MAKTLVGRLISAWAVRSDTFASALAARASAAASAALSASMSDPSYASAGDCGVFQAEFGGGALPERKRQAEVAAYAA